MDSLRHQQLPDQAVVETMDLPLIEAPTATAMDLLCYNSASYQRFDEFEQRSQFERAADTTFQAVAAVAKGQNRSAVRLARPAALYE